MPPDTDRPSTHRNGTVPPPARRFRRGSLDQLQLSHHNAPPKNLQSPKTERKIRNRRGSINQNHSADLIAQGEAKVDLMLHDGTRGGKLGLAGLETMSSRAERLGIERHKTRKSGQLSHRDYKMAVKSWGRYDIDDKGKLDMQDWMHAVHRISPSLSAQAPV